MSKERRNITLAQMPVNVQDNIGTYFFAPFQVAGSANDKAEYEGGLYDEDAELTLDGTTTTSWSDNVGWLTPNSTSGNPVIWAGTTSDTSDVFWDKTRLDDGTVFKQHGILLHLDFYYTANPSAIEHLIASGEKDVTAGGWSIEILTNGTVSFNYKSATVSHAYITSAVLTKNQRNSIFMYLDFTNQIVTGIINGGTAGQGSTWTNPLLITRDTRTMCLFGGGQSTVPANGLLGEHASGARIKNIFIIRPNTDISNNLSIIANAFYDNENALPAELVTYGVVGG